MDKNTQIKTDCFAYNCKSNQCNALKELYCKKGECSFYNNTLDRREIEREISNYINKK